MKPLAALCLLLAACNVDRSGDHYGFVTLLGRDTISAENVTRRGNVMVSESVDRFPRVRQRHTEATLAPDGHITRLVMDIRTPSARLANDRERRSAGSAGVAALRRSHSPARLAVLEDSTPGVRPRGYRG